MLKAQKHFDAKAIFSELKDATVRKADVPEEGFFTVAQWAEMTEQHPKIVQETFKSALSATPPKAIRKMYKVPQGTYIRATPHFKVLP